MKFLLMWTWWDTSTTSIPITGAMLSVTGKNIRFKVCEDLDINKKDHCLQLSAKLIKSETELPPCLCVHNINFTTIQRQPAHCSNGTDSTSHNTHQPRCFGYISNFHVLTIIPPAAANQIPQLSSVPWLHSLNSPNTGGIIPKVK